MKAFGQLLVAFPYPKTHILNELFLGKTNKQKANKSTGH